MATLLATFKEKTVLLVENDDDSRLHTAENLRVLFKRVLLAKDCVRALITYESMKPDIVLIEVDMDDNDGLNLIKHIREKEYATPIVVMANRDEHSVVMSLLSLSIDAYVLKPFSIDNLIGLISNALRRNGPAQTILTLAEDIYYNYTTREIYKQGIPIMLGNKEHAFIRFLIEHHPETATKEVLFERLWPLETSSGASLKNIVLRLRKKLGVDILTSVRSVGYRLKLSQ